VAQRHDGVRNLLTSFLGKVCTNVEVERQLQSLDERFNLRNAVTSPEARLDMKAGGFSSRGVTAFFDVRVTHVNSKCNQGKATSTIFKGQEKKKRKYQQRVLDVEMGYFPPLVFGTNGGMGADCNCFLKRLTEKLSEKNEEPYHITITWIRTFRGTQRIISVNYLFGRPLILSDFLKGIVTSNFRRDIVRNLMSVVFGLLKMSFWVSKKGQLSSSERR